MGIQQWSNRSPTGRCCYALRQELDEARAVATAARVSEEARVMEEQLAQTQTIEALRRQVETSNNAA